jgi:hypothetical protein
VAARLIDKARAATLDVLGDTEGATSMTARRLRATVSDDAGPQKHRHYEPIVARSSRLRLIFTGEPHEPAVRRRVRIAKSVASARVR